MMGQRFSKRICTWSTPSLPSVRTFTCHTNESHHTRERVMSHCVTHLHHAPICAYIHPPYKRVTSHTWTSHVTLCHTWNTAFLLSVHTFTCHTNKSRYTWASRVTVRHAPTTPSIPFVCSFSCHMHESRHTSEREMAQCVINNNPIAPICAPIHMKYPWVMSDTTTINSKLCNEWKKPSLPSVRTLIFFTHTWCHTREQGMSDCAYMI